MRALTEFWEHIEAQLSTTLVDGGGGERTVAALQETPGVDVVLLHGLTLSVSCAPVERNNERYALWMQTGDLFSRISELPMTPSMTMTMSCVGGRVLFIAVTKSGNLTVLKDSVILFLSIADGSVISRCTFNYEGQMMTVDTEGQFWTSSWSGAHTVRCYSREGRLLRKMTTSFLPHSIVFLSDDRIVLCGITLSDHNHNVHYALYFYSADGEEIQSPVRVNAKVVEILIGWINHNS